ncbi:hypothetical protein PybrP1_008430 [[Pythium] brassicae (nom. inval.)]|nr:hypothetical protein PybrP1_008430 [[Pythium] brassicae (nom. inval.)]
MAARRDDATEVSRRGRAKRPGGTASASSTPPPPLPSSASSAGGGRMDLMLAAAAAATADPSAAFHPPPAYATYQSFQPPTDPVAKHKRVKKSEAEWAAPPSSASSSGSGGLRISSLMGPPQPPPAMQPAHSISSLTAPPPPPSVSSAGSLASILSAASPVPTTTAPSPTASVFRAPPAPVPSFAETERRRAAAPSTSQTNGKSGGTATSGARALKSSNNSSGGASLSMLELFFPAGDAAAATPAAAASSSSADVPTKSLKRKRRTDPAAGASAGPTSAPTAEYDLLRFGVDASKLVPQGLVDRVDAKMDPAFIGTLIRSHVGHWSARAGFGSRFLAELAPLLTAYYPCHYPTILDHVLASFLFKRPEFTELLLKPMIEKLQKLGEPATGAKYPVIDAFARTCCYLQYHEPSTAATTSAAGNLNGGVGRARATTATTTVTTTTTTTTTTDRARHDFACETLLQCLLESNTDDTFLLSPGIAACAARCSDAVLETLWRQIVGAWRAAEGADKAAKTLSSSSSAVTLDADALEADDDPTSDTTTKRTSKPLPNTPSTWSIAAPLQQAFALLDEEQQLEPPPPLLRSRHGGDAHHTHAHASAGGRGGVRYRLASALVRLVLRDASLQRDAAVTSSPLMRQALGAAWGRGSGTLDSSALLVDRLSSHHGDNSDNEFAPLLHCVVHAASGGSLSVRSSNWFARHVLRLLLAPAPARLPRRERALAEVTTRYMPLLLGSTARSDEDEVADGDRRQASRGELGQVVVGSTETKREGDGNGAGPWDAMETSEELSVPEIVDKVVCVLELLDTSVPSHAATFLDAWTAAWTNKASGASPVPWGYVHALVLAALDEEVIGRLRYVGARFQALAAHTCRRHLQQQLEALETQPTRHAAVATRLSALLDTLLSSPPAEFAHALLGDVVGAIRQFDNAATGSSSSSGVFKNAVLMTLGEGKPTDLSSLSLLSSPSKRGGSSHKTSDGVVVASPLPSTQRAPRIEVELRVLVALLKLAELDDATGRFTRTQLSARPVVRVLAGLLRDVAGNRFKLAKLVDLLDAVITRRRSSEEAVGAEWTRQHVVQQFVATAYSVAVPSVADRLVGLVQSLARQRRGGADALWATLRHCTQLCCGCRGGSSVDQFHLAAAASFAELVKVLLCADAPGSAATVRDGAIEFVQQELASCGAHVSRLNMFLLLVLQKTASAARAPRACLSVVQRAVFSLGATTQDRVRLLQLQLLQALCARLAGIRRRRGLVAGGRWRAEDADECARCEELVCNERLQCDLRRIVAADGVGASSSRASVVLAQSVLQ